MTPPQDPLLHETHVCRDCEAEITLPYASARQDEPGLRTALLKLNRSYIGGKVTLDADAFDGLVLAPSAEPPETETA